MTPSELHITRRSTGYSATLPYRTGPGLVFPNGLRPEMGVIGFVGKLALENQP